MCTSGVGCWTLVIQAVLSLPTACEIEKTTSQSFVHEARSEKHMAQSGCANVRRVFSAKVHFVFGVRRLCADTSSDLVFGMS